MNCTAVIRDRDGGQRHCARKAQRDGLCTQHHPDWPAKVEANAARVRADVAAMLTLVENPDMVRDARLDELERVVAELADRAGIAFKRR